MQLIDTRPEYPPYWDDQDDREEWVNKRANKLLEDDCDPLNPVNLAEFIGNLDHKNEDENALLTKLRVLIVKHKADFEPILEANCDYWTKEAERIAESDFESGEFFDDGEPWMKWLIIAIYLTHPCDSSISSKTFDTQKSCLKAAQDINHETKPDTITCIQVSEQSITQMRKHVKFFKGKHYDNL